ncbi:hypothetical protein BGW36DRAFT_432893 [Talaromyces proteolyticus]|uniref:Rhodopsin domain-containing protein n=1 Tax=Talaromyces proteolyticus TaxID=1131652 RepID=A0AAD4KEA4_9EURO|nr:uncharacterized protein BGW36DRAFT_432893 [Talaromyces proteolyticus]KAH8689928.1 hypothetical protein BGW36DRAFT_432893 [Talaromyces proteolyticus]
MLTSASTAMIVTMAVFMVVSGLSVALRLHLRRQRRISLEADDYLVVAAWVFAAALAITNIVGVPVGGFGTPYEELGDEKAEKFLKIFFILQFWYIISVALVKFSILFLYGRVFGIGRFPSSVLVLLGITAAWLISFLFATFFQIWPLRCNWVACDPTTNYAVMYVLSSVTDIVIDISILALPVFFIRKLRFSTNQKIGVCGIFGLGIFCVVSSVARLAYTVIFQISNIEGNYAVNFNTAVVNIIMWSGIEVCASVLCANLPCYGPLISRARNASPISQTITSFFSIRPSRRLRSDRLRSDSLKRTSVQSPSASRENILGLKSATENIIESRNLGDTPSDGLNMELGGIRVDNSFNVD